MKHTLLFCIFFLPLVARAQSFVNPDTIAQNGDIILQNMDVYYTPMAPPSSHDRSANLCNLAMMMLDSNGLYHWPYYVPKIYKDSTSGYIPLQQWSPHGTPLGPTARWQRFFTAKRKHDGSASDIVAGSNVDMTHSVGTGYVIISPNEDVDFRATGRIKLKNGFRAKAGCRFHAYIEPKWGSTVFSDEFDSSALDQSKWYIAKGYGDYNEGAQCSSDSNVIMVTDMDAHDGHAVDILIREVPDSCACNKTAFNVLDDCTGTFVVPDTTIHSKFSSATIVSCPWPWTSVSTTALGGPTYQNGPYGKYEVRIKIPHVEFHNNTWGAGNFEWDLNEEWNQPLNQMHATLYFNQHHGPFKGIFGPKSLADTTPVFRSSAAQFSNVNVPGIIIINGFPYDVQYTQTPTDTFLAARWQTQWSGGFPSSIAHSTDSFTFYYDRSGNNTTDPITWHVDTDSYGKWRIFSAPYRILSGDTMKFSKTYQPTSIIITPGFGLPKTYNCFWDSSLNSSADTGKLYMTDTMAPTDFHSNTEAYQYTIDEGYGWYPQAPFPFDGDDTEAATYKYHTYGMELLPNEVRFLVDSAVVSRIPDRLVPRSSPYYNRAAQVVRSIPNIELNDMDIDLTSNDPYGLNSSINYISGGDTVYNSVTYAERHYFETHPNNPGRGWVTIGGIPYNAAHVRVDYFKIWDLPSTTSVPPFPH